MSQRLKSEQDEVLIKISLLLDLKEALTLDFLVMSQPMSDEMRRIAIKRSTQCLGDLVVELNSHGLQELINKRDVLNG